VSYTFKFKPTVKNNIFSRKLDPTNLRSVNAALNFLSKRKVNSQARTCPQNVKSSPNGKLEVINSRDLSKLSNKILVCRDLTTRPLTDSKACNFDFTLPGAVSETRF
jgi:hypothetical protein